MPDLSGSPQQVAYFLDWRFAVDAGGARNAYSPHGHDHSVGPCRLGNWLLEPAAIPGK
jgi:hypothetical protein